MKHFIGALCFRSILCCFHVCIIDKPINRPGNVARAATSSASHLPSTTCGSKSSAIHSLNSAWRSCFIGAISGNYRRLSWYADEVASIWKKWLSRSILVTAQVVDLVQNRRREFARDVGSPVRASMMAQPCFLAVDRNERMSAKSMAPSIERNRRRFSGATSSCGRRARPDCW